MADVGFWALVLTLIVSAYSAVAAVLGARRGPRASERNGVLLESARNGAFVAAVAATAASVILIVLLLTRDLSVKYVSEHVNSHLPTAYRLSAFWAGQEGSLLIWLWMVTLLTVALIVLKTGLERAFWALCPGVMALTQGFLALVIVVLSNPFEMLASVPA